MMDSDELQSYMDGHVERYAQAERAAAVARIARKRAIRTAHKEARDAGLPFRQAWRECMIRENRRSPGPDDGREGQAEPSLPSEPPF